MSLENESPNWIVKHNQELRVDNLRLRDENRKLRQTLLKQWPIIHAALRSDIPVGEAAEAIHYLSNLVKILKAPKGQRNWNYES